MKKIISLLLAFAMFDPLWAGSSLTFGGAITDRVVVTDTQDLKEMTNFTLCIWVYPTTLTSERIFAKNNSDLLILGASGQLRFRRGRVTSTQELLPSNLFLTLNKWQLVAITFDKTNSPVAHMYIGDQTIPAREPAYTNQLDGIGNWLVDAGNIFIGNRSALDASFRGQIGPVMYSSMVMTLDQINSWRLIPTNSTGTQMMLNIGFDADSAIQQDLSGKGNSGVITGAVSSSNGPPINFPGGPN